MKNANCNSAPNYLVGNVVEILDIHDEDKVDGANQDLDSACGHQNINVTNGLPSSAGSCRETPAKRPHWHDSPYLSNPHTLELASHSENVRSFYTSWGRILQSSPGLKKTLCSAHYSGPKMPADDLILAWRPNVDRRIQLKELKELNLTSLDPDYLCGDLVDRLYFPNLRELTLDSPDLEYTPFITLLTNPLLRSSSDANAHTQATTSRSSSLFQV